MRLVLFILLLIITSCKYENKPIKKATIYKDSFKTKDSLIYHVNDSIRLNLLYGKKKTKVANKDKIYNISIMPSVLGSYIFDFCDVTIKNDTISGELYESSIDKVLKKKRIRKKVKLSGHFIYFYTPKNISFYNHVIAKVFLEKLDKWAISEPGLDGGSVLVKQTNSQNQVNYYELFWYIFDGDKEAKYFYNTLCKELVGRTFE